MPGVPRGMACDSLTGLCITVSQALGLCSEIVPTGKTFGLWPQVCPREQFYHTTLQLEPQLVPDLLKLYPYVSYIDGLT